MAWLYLVVAGLFEVGWRGDEKRPLSLAARERVGARTGLDAA